MGNDSYDQRYSQLQSVRENWCRNARDIHDRSGITVDLDGRDLVDIPSFYLALGCAVNGPDGYYGGNLEALSDCLCGGFGLVPPFTLRIRHAMSRGTRSGTMQCFVGVNRGLRASNLIHP